MLARQTDPATSHIAAQMAIVFIEDHCSLILAALHQGPAGKTALAEATGLDHVAIARRLPELERQGKARPTGRTVRSGAGRPEREWAAC